MNYRIEKKDEIRVVGVKERFKNNVGVENNVEIPKFWGQSQADGSVTKVCALINKEPQGILGVCGPIINDSEEFDYYIAAPTDKPVPAGMCEYIVPAATYAIFEAVGPLPNAVQDMWKRIWTEWLPSSGYEYEGTDLEVYSDGDTMAKDYKCWAWLSVVKAK